MLEITTIVLVCIGGIEAIVIQVLRRKLRDAHREIASWKLAVESYEKERTSW